MKMKSCSSILPRSNRKRFLAGFSMTEPNNILLVVTEKGRDCWKLPFKTTKKDKAEMQEVAVSLADANEISMNVAIAAIL